MRSMTDEGEPQASGFSLIRPTCVGILLAREKEESSFNPVQLRDRV